MHPQIINYQILSSTLGNGELAARVLARMNGEEGGWQPWGDPYSITTIVNDKVDTVICQAMVQYELNQYGEFKLPPQPTYHND